MMLKVKNKARVHGSLIMMGLTIVGYIVTVVDAKRAVSRGETMEKYNADIHERYGRQLQLREQERLKDKDQK